MAVYVIDGKIGSGKTYYAIYYIVKKYYQYDEFFNEYFPRRDLILVSNIDNLKLEHIDLRTEVEKYGLEYVFSEEYVNSLRSNKRLSVIFVIDEAQSPLFFHRKYYNEKVFFFFQYSRHYGVDIFLITQDVESLAKEIRVLPEYLIHAVARTHTSGFNFQYKFISNSEVIRTKVVKIDKRIFNLYKSFNFDESEKPKPVYLRYFVFIFVSFLVAVLAFKFVFLSSFSSSNNVSNNSNDNFARQYNLEKRADSYYTRYGNKVYISDSKVISANSSSSYSSSDNVFSVPLTNNSTKTFTNNNSTNFSSVSKTLTKTNFIRSTFTDIPSETEYDKIDKIETKYIEHDSIRQKITHKQLRDYDFVSNHCDIHNSVYLFSHFDSESILIENFICDNYSVSFRNYEFLSFSKLDSNHENKSEHNNNIVDNINKLASPSPSSVWGGQASTGTDD